MQKQEMVFSDYLRVILKRRTLVVLVTLLVTFATYYWASQKIPVFRSMARIKVVRYQTFANFFDEMMVSSGDPIENYILEVTGDQVLLKAKEKLRQQGSAYDDLDLSVSAERLPRTDLIDIFVTGNSSTSATERCQAVVEAFRDVHDAQVMQSVESEYNNITRSLEETTESLRKLENSFKGDLGNRALTEAAYEEVKLLRGKLLDAQIRLQTLRNDGNYTEEYPEVLVLAKTVEMMGKQLGEVSAREVEIQSSIREYEQRKRTLEEIANYLAKRHEEAKIARKKQRESIEVVKNAIPGVKVTTPTGYLTAVGTILGIMMGIILAFVAENLDTSIRTLLEIEETFGLQILGVVPHFSRHAQDVPIHPEGLWNKIKYSEAVSSLVMLWRVLVAGFASRRNKGSSGTGGTAISPIVVPFYPRSPATEGYRGVRTNLKFLFKKEGRDRKCGAILMTSAGPAEGKSTTLVNLAFAFAQAGDRTLVVGANMRRPSMYKTFGLDRARGLSEILTGEIPWREAVKDNRDLALGQRTEKNLATAPGSENLFFITCGGRTIHPSEWLSQPLFEAVVKEWEEEFDVVLIDGTPILPVPDSVIMSSAIRRVALVYKVDVAQREPTLRAIELLKNAGAKIYGLIINDVQASWSATPDYYHYRGYYGTPEKR